MKLLFDENLSPKLARRLADIFPDSSHVHFCDLGATDDTLIWKYAALNGFCVVSQDTDFRTRGESEGAPPKLIWLNAGNCTTAQIEQLLRYHSATIHTFEASPDETILILR